MRRALHAEWTKLRTVAGPRWLLLGAVVLTVAVGASAGSVVTCSSTACGHDQVRIALIGVGLGQALVAVLGVAVISGECGSGTIATTLVATPRRGTVLAAKAVVLSGAVAAAGTIAVLGSLLVARAILPGRGFTAAHGCAPLSLADGPTLRATVGSVLYLVLIALLALGIATVVRDAATGVGIVLALLHLIPLVAQAVGDPDLRELLERIGPGAGLAIQATTDLPDRPIGPWAGIGVLAAWAAVALLLAARSIQRRDG